MEQQQGGDAQGGAKAKGKGKGKGKATRRTQRHEKPSEQLCAIHEPTKKREGPGMQTAAHHRANSRETMGPHGQSKRAGPKAKRV
jgi:hypothetical protein